MSEEPMTPDEVDLSPRGERRRALRAERDRQAQRDRPDGPPPPPPALVRPYAAPPQDSAVLLADAPATPAAGVPDDVRRTAETQPLAERPPAAPPPPEPVEAASPESPAAQGVEPEPAQRAGDDLVPAEDAGPPPLPVRVRGAEFPLGGAPAPLSSPSSPSAFSGAESPEWSAFTPVIPPEPLRFDDHPPAPWERPGPWTQPSTPPSGSWMDVEERPAADEVGPAPEESPAETVWTAPQGFERPRAEPAGDGPEPRYDDLGDDEWLRQLRGDEAAEQEGTPPPGVPAPDGDTDAGDVREVPAAGDDTTALVDDVPQAEPREPVQRPQVPDPAPFSPSGGFSLFEPTPRPPDVEPSDDGSTAGGGVQLPPLPEALVPEVSTPPATDAEELEPSEPGPSEPEPAEPSDGPEPGVSEPVAEDADAGRPAWDEPDAVPFAEPSAVSSAERDDERDEEYDDEPDDEHDEAPVPDRPSFGRAPSQRLSEVVLHDEDRGEPDEDEPVRGTLAPVLRRSTERARYPTSTTPVIRPPVMPPPPPGEAAPVVAPPARPVTWEQALAGDVLPGKKRRPQGVRRSKPRHESGGPGEEYKPVKPPPDRSLTLLVVGMLLVLLGLVAVAGYYFYKTRVGGAADGGRSAVVAGAPRAVGGP